MFSIPPHLITFVRHPLYRAISEFDFNLVHNDWTPDIIQKRFSEFSTSSGQYIWHNKIAQNNRVHFLNRVTNELGPYSLETFWFVGITEYFESSMCILFYKMGIPDVKRCGCARRNQGLFVHNDHNLTRRIDKNSVNSKHEESILNNTRHDMKLYQRGVGLLFNEANSLFQSTGVDFLCADREKITGLLQKFRGGQE